MKLFYQCWLVSCIVIFFSINHFEAKAQIRVKGTPESFSRAKRELTNIPVFRLDSLPIQQMRDEDQKFMIDNRYGIVQQCAIDLKEMGVKTEIPGKGNIWQFTIKGENALSLGINFKAYNLPKGATVFMYDSTETHTRGAFTDQNNNPEHQLPIAEFPGNNLTIEYFEPSTAEFSGELVVGAVSQAYLDINSTSATRIGINCPQGANWQTEKTCVCRMTYHDSKYSYFCSGALINNVREDGKPYFLTANHCIDTEAEANTLVTYFNYENSSCSSSDASTSQTLSGATLKSGSSYSDFSLLLLNEYPAEEYNAYYAGWDVQGKNPESGVCIHHPAGTPKCITTDKDQIISYAYATKWTDSSGNVISTTPANTHWVSGFDEGSTEGGSSGSPLFDQNKHIVGQLHGGSTSQGIYGKLSLSWDYYTDYSEQLAHWLDPDNTGKKVLDGIGQRPPIANFAAEIQQVCVNAPITFTDASKNNPTQWTWTIQPASYSFTNGTNASSQNPQIIFQKEGIYSVTLTAANKYGSNQKTQSNYIVAKSKLDVKFLRIDQESTICGCNLTTLPLIASGAYSYTYKVSNKEMIEATAYDDSLHLALSSKAEGGQPFDSWVKVTGTHGTCSASDSILLHVIIQPNDNAAHATNLSLGRNTGYSNRCATVETNEPSPSASEILPNSWSYDTGNTSGVLNNSVWFTFHAPSTGIVSINTSGFDDQIAVYEATSYSTLLSGISSNHTLLSANDNRSSSDKTAAIENLTLEPGKQYWLQVDGNSAAYGDLTIDLISNSIEVYPNPSTGIFNLIIANPFTGYADVVVSDLQGRELFKKQYLASLTSNKFTIDLSAYTKGMYLLNVRINGSTLSKKLIRW